jgi:hypothetical protein
LSTVKFAAVFLLTWIMALAGCASYQTRIEPGKQLDGYKRFWVKSNFDDNHAIDHLIVRALRQRGLEAECGPMTMKPFTAQAVITFRDHWTWDFKNHMAGLELVLQDAKAETAVATASFAGPMSLSSSPSEVVERLIQKLLDPPKAARKRD